MGIKREHIVLWNLTMDRLSLVLLNAMPSPPISILCPRRQSSTPHIATGKLHIGLKTQSLSWIGTTHHESVASCYYQMHPTPKDYLHPWQSSNWRDCGCPFSVVSSLYVWQQTLWRQHPFWTHHNQPPLDNPECLTGKSLLCMVHIFTTHCCPQINEPESDQVIRGCCRNVFQIALFMYFCRPLYRLIYDCILFPDSVFGIFAFSSSWCGRRNIIKIHENRRTISCRGICGILLGSVTVADHGYRLRPAHLYTIRSARYAKFVSSRLRSVYKQRHVFLEGSPNSIITIEIRCRVSFDHNLWINFQQFCPQLHSLGYQNYTQLLKIIPRLNTMKLSITYS